MCSCLSNENEGIAALIMLPTATVSSLESIWWVRNFDTTETHVNVCPRDADVRDSQSARRTLLFMQSIRTGLFSFL